MSLFPKSCFKWKEPAEFVARRKEEERKNWSIKSDFLIAGIIAGAVILFWTFVKIINPEKPPSFHAAATLGILGGLFMVCLVHLMHRFISYTEVAFFVKRFVHQRDGGTLSLNWRHVASCRFEEAGESAILIIKLNSGQEVKLGLSPEIKAGDLDEFFTEIGVTTVTA